MKTLLQKAGGSYELAIRFVKFVIAKRDLQSRLARMDALRATLAVQCDQLRRDLRAKDALIDDMHKAKWELPTEAKALIEDAHVIFEHAQTNHVIPFIAAKAWLVDYIAWKQARHRQMDWG